MKPLILIVISFVVVLGCQQMPTRVSAEDPTMSENITAEKLMQQGPVILDARPPFEFNLAHTSGAINVRWEDFSQQNPKSRGLLQNDLFALARRLALIGIDLDSKVVVLGKSSQGMGEEGRIAWTLRVLGVQQVYTLDYNSFRQMNQTQAVPLVKNKPYWKPEVNESLSVNLPEFKSQVQSKNGGVVVLDVRSNQEFAHQNLAQMKGVRAQVVNIDWKDFFDDRGLPDHRVENLLQQKGITKDMRIFVISNHGVRSGAATYVLNYLGYGNVSNFAGGYEQWR